MLAPDAPHVLGSVLPGPRHAPNTLYRTPQPLTSCRPRAAPPVAPRRSCACCPGPGAPWLTTARGRGWAPACAGARSCRGRPEPPAAEPAMGALVSRGPTACSRLSYTCKLNSRAQHTWLCSPSTCMHVTVVPQLHITASDASSAVHLLQPPMTSRPPATLPGQAHFDTEPRTQCAACTRHHELAPEPAQPPDQNRMHAQHSCQAPPPSKHHTTPPGPPWPTPRPARQQQPAACESPQATASPPPCPLQTASGCLPQKEAARSCTQPPAAA
jgi:hypothetical protein